MTTESLPTAVDAGYLTAALRKSGVLGDGCVREVVVENSYPTVLSHIFRLRLSYDGASAERAGFSDTQGRAARTAPVAHGNLDYRKWRSIAMSPRRRRRISFPDASMPMRTWKPAPGIFYWKI